MTYPRLFFSSTFVHLRYLTVFGKGNSFVESCTCMFNHVKVSWFISGEIKTISPMSEFGDLTSYQYHCVECPFLFQFIPRGKVVMLTIFRIILTTILSHFVSFATSERRRNLGRVSARGLSRGAVTGDQTEKTWEYCPQWWSQKQLRDKTRPRLLASKVANTRSKFKQMSFCSIFVKNISWQNNLKTFAWRHVWLRSNEGVASSEQGKRLRL